MKLTYLQILKIALEAQRRITAMNLPVVVITGVIDNVPYISLMHTNVDNKYKHFDTIQEFKATYIEKAKELCEPKLIPVAKACIDLIGNKIYFDKEHPYIVKSILSKTTVLTECGKELDLNRVYIKD